MTSPLTKHEIDTWRKKGRIYRIQKEVEYLYRWLDWMNNVPAKNIRGYLTDAYRDWVVDFVKDDTETFLLEKIDQAKRLLELLHVNWEKPEWEE